MLRKILIAIAAILLFNAVIIPNKLLAEIIWNYWELVIGIVFANAKIMRIHISHNHNNRDS